MPIVSLGARAAARLLCLLGATLAASSAFAAKFHDETDASMKGGITAEVSSAKDLQEVIVVEPTEYRAYVASIDRKAGRFTIRGIPPGKYGLLLKCRTRVLEGIMLDVPGEEETLEEQDVDGIEKVIWESDDFFNDKTIARMEGNSKRVKLIVQQVRDKKTYKPSGEVMKGQMVRRIEITEMRKTGKIWTIKKTRHIFREETKKDGPGAKLEYFYVPSLGGIRVGDRMVELEKIDPANPKHVPPDRFHRSHHRE